MAGPFHLRKGSSGPANNKRTAFMNSPAYIAERKKLEADLTSGLLNEPPLLVNHPTRPGVTIKLPPLAALMTNLAERSFKEFMKQALAILEPGRKFKLNWMNDAMCDHLQITAEGIAANSLGPDDPPYVPLDAEMPWPKDTIRNLILNVPPRSLKSSIAAVLFPAWAWIHWPHLRFMFISYSHTLSTRDSRRCRQVIESDWYQQRWGRKFKLAPDSNTLIRFDNSQGGFRYAVSVQGQIMGEGADIILLDDANNTKDIHSKSAREKVHAIWDDVLPTRHNDPKTGVWVILQQRSHALDITGYVLKQAEDDPDIHWEVVRIPAEFEVKHCCVTSIWRDPRTKPGELINPDRFGPQEIRILKKRLRTAFNIAAQLQQRPVPLEGGIFEHDWWQTYRWSELQPISQWTSSCISVDMNFGSKSDKASFVVFQAWCRIGARFHLLGQMRGQWKFTKAKRNLIKFIQRFHYIYAIYVENKANGPAIMDELMETNGLSGLIPVEPDGDKEARAEAVAPLVEARNCYLPDPEQPGCNWVNEEFYSEVDLFPMAGTDDITDTMTQALRKLRGEVAFGSGSDDLDRVLGAGGAGSDDDGRAGYNGLGGGSGYSGGFGDPAFNENGALDGWSGAGFDSYGMGGLSTMNVFGASGMINYGTGGTIPPREITGFVDPESGREVDVAGELSEFSQEDMENLEDSARGEGGEKWDGEVNSPKVKRKYLKPKLDPRVGQEVVRVVAEPGFGGDFWGI